MKARWRRYVRDLGIVAVVFLVGYVIAASWISPGPLFFGHRDHAVPPVLGLPEAEARERLTTLGFRPRVTGTRVHPTLRAGVVAWQDPPPDVISPSNEVVTLVLSAGPSPVAIPDVAGLDTVLARRVLAAAGVSVGDITFITGRESGVVFATRPGVGTARPRGTAVDLVVTRAPEEHR